MEGSLKDLSIFDIFQLLCLSRKSGILTVQTTKREGKGIIYFKDGSIIHATTTSLEEEVGDSLVEEKRLTEAQLRRAQQIRKTSGDSDRLSDILVKMGLISRAELIRHLRSQAEKTVYKLLNWSEGYFKFEGGEPILEDKEVGTLINTQNLILEGARRIREWPKIRQKIPSKEIVFALAGRQEEIEDRDNSISDINLQPEEWLVLSLIDGKRSVEDIIKTMKWEEFKVEKILYGLLASGLIIKAEEEPEGYRELEIDDYIEKGSSYLEEGLYKEAQEEFSRLSQIAPDNKKVHIILGKIYDKQGIYEQALIEYRKASALDPQNKEIHLAIGDMLYELASYVEAMKEYKICLELDPLYAEAHYNLGYVLSRLGRCEEAVQEWRDFLSLTKDNDLEELIRSNIQIAEEWMEVLSKRIRRI